MKKHLIIGVIVLMIIMPIAGASDILSTGETEVNKPMMATKEDFTHTVLAEFATTTKCGFCPTASSQLYSIYSLGDYDFYYVSLVINENYKVYSRVKELGVTHVPDVYFDGGYRNLLGAQEDEQPYRDAIVQCGERAVPDIDVDVDVKWTAKAILKIKVTVQNNEPEDYDGVLRVYIVEPESRWKDSSGKIYHFGVLDIPIDEPLAVPHGQPYGQPRALGDTYTFKKTWFGILQGFGDITRDNIMVIASVFDKNYDYAVQTAAAEPTSSSTSQYCNIPQRYTGVVFLELLERLVERFPLLHGLLNFKQLS